MGRMLSPAAAAAVVVVRLASLAGGYSGVRLCVLERLCELVNRGIVPVMPEEGSVGASGDLTPLSYLAAVLIGEREVYYQGARCSTGEIYALLGISPIVFRPKEALSIMNGTSVMTALSCLAFHRAEYLVRFAARLTALAVEVIGGNRGHFDPLLFSAKPFPGQRQIAAWINSDLEPVTRRAAAKAALQDRYSLRCAPHVIGVLADALPWMKEHLEIEINSANDNPLIDVDGMRFLHGGHFYGGHVAFVMDSMKNAVANLADLLDRQFALLMDASINNGLPANLSGAEDQRMPINHGFKAVQIASSAWTGEALKLTLPASVFSRSTESHNQDKVSMGTVAARDCLRVIELTEQVAAAEFLAVLQGLRLRLRERTLSKNDLSPALREICDSVESEIAFVGEDRPLESDLRTVTASIQGRRWGLYE